jgi:hypothetical protein
MTSAAADKLIISIVNAALKRGFTFDGKKKRVDKVDMLYGQIAIFYGTRYLHRRNENKASLYSVRVTFLNHNFAKAMFKSDWQEALKQLVLMRTVNEQVEYIKRFI